MWLGCDVGFDAMNAAFLCFRSRVMPVSTVRAHKPCLYCGSVACRSWTAGRIVVHISGVMLRDGPAMQL